MRETGAARLRPEVVFVPPPPGPGMPPKRIVGPLGGCAVGGVACLVLVIANGGTLLHWLALMGVICVVVAHIVAVRAWRMDRVHQALRRAFFDKQPNAEADPLATALRKAWPEPDRSPKLEDVQRALREAASESHAGRARIICFGEAEVPEVGELHFEPEIVTPTVALWRQLFWLVIAGVLLVWCLLDWLNVLPGWLPGTEPLVWCFAYFMVAGAIALVAWVRKALIRPTYIRMAPGIIQVLEYRYAKSKPTIRSYPMNSGTLAILARVQKRLVLTLARDEMKDVLLLSRMRQPDQLIKRTWQALLSTAATPPLSDEELVG